MLTNMNVQKGLTSLKRIYFSGAVILGAVFLSIGTIKGFSQSQTNSLQNPSQAAAPSSSLAVSPPQTPTQQPATEQAVPVLELEKQLINFERMLSQSAKEHQDFLETQEEHHQKFLELCYSLTAAFLSACVFAFGAILTWLHFNTRGSIKRIVDERITADIDAQIAKAIKQTEKKIETATNTASASINKFNQHLGSLQKSTENRVNELKSKLESDNVNVLKVASHISLASVVLSRFSPEKPQENEADNPSRREYIQSLKEIQKWAPTDRTIVVYIGRLYRQLGDYDAAIKELADVIKKRDERGENKGIYAQDHSDVLFNKACYLNLKADGAGAQSESLRKDAWKTISESVRIWPANLEDAKNDEDFNGLTNETRLWENLKH